MDSWRWVTDGGLETDLIFHRGVDLPEFAAYPLVWSDEGRALLREYYSGYAEVAARAGRGLRLETPTWRANPDWGAVLRHDETALADANQRAVALMQEIGDEWRDRLPEVTVVGMVGPRGDGYVAADGVDPDEAAEYHAAQLASFAAAGADAAAVTDHDRARGGDRRRRAPLPPWACRSSVGFTLETDGRLPDGTTLGDAVGPVDDAAPPAWFMVNCAHPAARAPGVRRRR